MSEIKTLTLDCAKWRCGDDGPFKVGKGPVALLNEQGFMCCLGQWCEQLGADKAMLLKKGEPAEIDQRIPFFTEELLEGEEDDYEEHETRIYYKSDKRFVGDAIGINDNPDSSPQEKIKALKELLAEEGVELVVINEDKLPDQNIY